MDNILKWYAEKAPMLPQGTFENNLIFLGLLALLVVCIIWMTRRMAKGRLNLSAAREREVELKAQLDSQAYLIRGQDVKVNDLTALLEEAQAQTPANRLALCRQARSENRHEQAIAHLVSLFDDLAPVVAACSRELAEYALSLATGADESRQLRTASRLARIATLCTPAGATAEQIALAAEIERRLPAARTGEDLAGEDLTATLGTLAPAYLGSGDLNAVQPQLDSLVERAIALHRSGFAQTAALILERACNIADARLDAGDRRWIQAQATLAAAFGSLGRFREEEAALKRLLEHEESTLGPRHPETLQTRQGLVFALGGQGRHDEAEALLRTIVAEQETTLGLKHPETLATRNNLAGALFRQGRFAEAEALFRDVWRGRAEALGAMHQDTQRAMGNLAQTLVAAGRHADARALWVELLAQQQRAFGADHPSTLKTRLQMADGLAKAGHRTEAAAVIRGILTKLMRVLGAGHPQTIAAAEALATLAQPTDGAAAEEPSEGTAAAEPAALAGVGASAPVVGGDAASRAQASLVPAVAKIGAAL